MARVAREVVERAGLDVGKLVEALVSTAGDELATYYYYTILRVNVGGLQGESLKPFIETARLEHRNHYEAVVPRIYELGGKLPAGMNQFHDQAACAAATLPSDPTDIKAVLEVLVEAERCAVRGYSELCDLTGGKDYRTFDLSLAILNEETEHESWFAEFLGEARPAIAPATGRSRPSSRSS